MTGAPTKTAAGSGSRASDDDSRTAVKVGMLFPFAPSRAVD